MTYLLTDDDTAPVEVAESAIVEVLEDEEAARDAFDMAQAIMTTLLDRGWTVPMAEDSMADVEGLAYALDPEAFDNPNLASGENFRRQANAKEHARRAVAAGWHSPEAVAAIEAVAQRRKEQGRRLIKQRNDARNALRELANKAADALVAAHIRRLDADEPGFSGPNNFYAGVSRARLEAMRVLGVSSLGKKHEIARQVLDHLDQSDV
jgi:hypothetical protein